MTMVARVARAIYASECNQTKEPGKAWRPTRLEEDENRELYFSYARAAIEAMVAPTTAMTDVGYGVFEESYDPSHCYSTMIRKALSE